MNFSLIMKILGAMAQVEQTIKGGGMKRDKAIAIALQGEKIAESAKPELREKIGAFIDTAVAVHKAAGPSGPTE